MQHLLMPIQAFLHVDQRSFYPVSEHAFMTLADVLLGVKQWPSMLCHDEIWSVVKQVLLKASLHKSYMTDLGQVLTGIGFLTSRGLQHTMLNLPNILVTNSGVVKIGRLPGQDLTSSVLMQAQAQFILSSTRLPKAGPGQMKHWSSSL